MSGWTEIAWRWRDRRMVNDAGNKLLWHALDDTPMSADAAIAMDAAGLGWAMHRHLPSIVILCWHPREGRQRP